MSEFEWSTEDEIQLFHALEGMKPVGIAKHFVMGVIELRLSQSLNKSVPREEIFKHLRTIYNLEMLDEREPIPFPNKEEEFHLPDEFKVLISNKISGGNNSSGDGEPTSTPSVHEKKTEQTSMNNGNNSTNSLTNSGTKEKLNNTPSSAKDKDLDKKASSKLNTSSSSSTSSSQEKRNSQKRTRGRDSLESNSPSTTPPPNQKRRRVI
ncbi:MRGBP family protein [Megaselia abdita]